jgi:hypothetical protein
LRLKNKELEMEEKYNPNNIMRLLIYEISPNTVVPLEAGAVAEVLQESKQGRFT